MNIEVVPVMPLLSQSFDEAAWLDYKAERDLRYRVLRAPLGMAPGSEENAHEWTCKHWLARADGRVAGCVLLHVFEDGGKNVGKLMQMAVEPELQGLGIGGALVRHVMAAARLLGIERIVLHARETAIPFYARLGATCEGEPFNEVGIPHWRMRFSIE